jgi:hypothetical protein
MTETTLKDGRVKFAAYCTCGLSMTGTTTANNVPMVRRTWERHGREIPGQHADTDSKTAAAERRRQERKEPANG